MTRRPHVRSTEVACPRCGTSLEVHLPPLVYTRLGLMDAGDGISVWAMSCPGPDCDGLLRVTVGDLHRAA